MGKANPILAPEPILALCERLRHHAHKARQPVAVDLRLAIVYLRRFASLAIADEAASEHDPDRKRKLEGKPLSCGGAAMVAKVN